MKISAVVCVLHQQRRTLVVNTTCEAFNSVQLIYRFLMTTHIVPSYRELVKNTTTAE